MPDSHPPTRPAAQAVQAGQDRRQWDELEAVLDKLDAQAELNPEHNQRKAVRAQFRRQHVRAQLTHPGGTVSACDVLTRDLSTGGLAFVHNGYVHVGTRVEVALRRPDGQEDAVTGTVMRCDHIARTWHSAGVKFDAKLDPLRYVAGLHDDDAAGDARPADPASLCGRLLHVDEDDLERRLLAHHLRQTGLEIIGVAGLSEAAEAIGGGPFDLVVTELRFQPRRDVPPEQSLVLPPTAQNTGGSPAAGRRAAKSPADVLRAAGHGGPLAVCTAEATEELLRSVAARHVRGVLCKPYTASRLLAKVAEWLAPPPPAAADDAPLTSPLADRADLRPRLAAYVSNLHKLASVLSAAAAAGQLDRCRAAALTLRGSAAGYGFPALAESAGEALAKLAPAAADAAEARPAVERLARLCLRAAA